MNQTAKGVPATGAASNRPTGAGVTDLAVRAVARLRADSHAGDLSVEVQKAVGSPMATALARALCDMDNETADLLLDDLLDAGLSVQDICLDHLAPAARRLGEWWDTDKVPFTDVTLATARIQAMLRRMPADSGPRRSRAGDPGAVFCAVPGEQHTLGVMMAADLFRRNGWDVGLMIGLTGPELLDRLRRDDRPIIGLSCSGDHSVAALAEIMKNLRRIRPNAFLMLSGQIVSNPARVAALPAADAVVTSVEDAEAQIARFERLVGAPRAVQAGR